jgi:quinol monooxygenase YgiN
MSAMVLIVELTLEPGQKDNFIARVRQHRQTVLKEEPGCRHFDLLLPEEGADTVVLHEVYDDQAALDVHMETPHMKAYRADTGPMVADRRRILSRLDEG